MSTQIPSMLKHDGIRFNRVLPKSKRPLDKKWQLDGGNNYRFDDEILLTHLEGGGNYGIVTGIANLFVIDADGPSIIDLVEGSDIADTFTVQTGGGGRHYYFFVDGFSKTKSLDTNEEQNIGHLKWKGSCVVGPGSIHPDTGKEYVVLKDFPIKIIGAEKIRFIFKDYFDDKAEVVREDERIYANEVRLPIDRVVSLNRLTKIGAGEQYQGIHPRHGSTGGMNFTVNVKKDVWHCFRHGTGGGTLHLIGVMNDIISCEDCVPGGVRGVTFKKILKIAKEKYGFELAADKTEIRTVKVDTSGVEPCKDAKELYGLVKETIETYMVMDPDDVTIASLWTIGVSQKDNFLTYPELFLNASKGSGKSRLMNLLTAMIPRAWVVAGISPAALFRLPSQEKANALFIDEADLNKEERADVRDILLVGYKKGGKIMRVVGEGATRHNEMFDVYMGYGMANIKGFDDIVSDRGITLTLSKSNDPERTKLMEYYEYDPQVKKIAKTLLESSDSSSRGVTSEVSDSSDATWGMAEIMQIMFKTALERVRDNMQKEEKTTVISDVNASTVTTVTTVTEINKIIDKIDQSKIVARDAEVWCPLFVVAAKIGDSELDDIIRIAESRSANKDDEQDEDVNFAMWLVGYYYADGGTAPTTCEKIKNAYVKATPSKDWMNACHISRTLLRLKCKINGNRMGSSRLLTIKIASVEEYLTIRGYDVDGLKPKGSKKEGQQDIKESVEPSKPKEAETPSLARPEPPTGQAGTGKELPLQGAVICPGCHKPTSKIYEYDRKMLCADCLNAKQHSNDGEIE